MKMSLSAILLMVVVIKFKPNAIFKLYFSSKQCGMHLESKYSTKVMVLNVLGFTQSVEYAYGN